jgi:hypothetical protein
MTHPELFPPIGSDKKSDRSSQRFRILELEVFSPSLPFSFSLFSDARQVINRVKL